MKHYTFNNAAVRLAGTNAAREFFEPMFIDRDRELLVVGLCDENVRIVELLSVPGEETFASISLLKILKRAICIECAAVIVAHNHPSGDTRPSKEDVVITCRLSQAVELLGIPLLDHLIFGVGQALSFREKGLL